ncbi:MAG: hypothetical protein M3Y87_04265 [Myxococcota bacterium]|nr:hypothetical protein [Myxococcota bacterium]
MRTVVAACVVIASMLAGCSSDRPELDDAGMGRDAALQEGGVVPTDGGPDGAARTDAGAIDAGTVAACAGGECDPRDIGGCPGEDAGVCALRDRLPACVASVGEVTEGESCVGDTDCAAALACFRDGGSVGICARVCCPGEIGVCGDETDERFYCRADGVLASGIATSWGRCSELRTCDVLAPERACAMGEGCYIESERMRSVCRYAGSGDVGAMCERQTDCRAGFFCAGVMTSTCVRICRLDDAASCPDAEGRCVAQAYSPPGSGVCVVSAAARG